MKRIRRYALLMAVAPLLAAGHANAAPTNNPQTLHVFYTAKPNGTQPLGLILGPDAAYYGITENGGIGIRGYGAFYRIDASTGRFSLLHQFDPTIDGCKPSLNLILGLDGNFYGIGSTFSEGQGCLFRLSATGEYTTVYTFDKGDSSASILYNLVEDAQGNWYGTGTEGAFRDGVVFELTRDGVFKTLHNFTAGSDGAEPDASLLLASDGNLYGSTRSGGVDEGQAGAGTLFRITPSGTFTTLHEFSYTESGDNGGPVNALVEGPDGALYGTTSGGSFTGNRNPAFFRMTLDGEVTTLFSFPNDPFGEPDPPSSALTWMPDGNFYGVCASPTVGDNGIIFRISPSGAYSQLYAFTGQGRNGSYPAGTLVIGVDNALYGTTVYGGSRNQGTVFRYVPPPVQ
ncbi:MAG: choice-of-anchor tandem repeat GloVer-containing protein [Thermoanaerobaculia bacterium]